MFLYFMNLLFFVLFLNKSSHKIVYFILTIIITQHLFTGGVKIIVFVILTIYINRFFHYEKIKISIYLFTYPNTSRKKTWPTSNINNFVDLWCITTVPFRITYNFFFSSFVWNFLFLSWYQKDDKWRRIIWVSKKKSFKRSSFNHDVMIYIFIVQLCPFCNDKKSSHAKIIYYKI